MKLGSFAQNLNFQALPVSNQKFSEPKSNPGTRNVNTFSHTPFASAFKVRFEMASACRTHFAQCKLRQHIVEI